MSDFWANERTFAPMLTSDDKAFHAANSTTFDVVGIKTGKTEYGETWFVDILLDGQRWAIPFAKNETRNEQFERMKAFLDENPGQAIPSRIVEVNTKSGFSAYVLNPPLPSNGDRQASFTVSNSEHPYSELATADEEPPF